MLLRDIFKINFPFYNKECDRCSPNLYQKRMLKKVSLRRKEDHYISSSYSPAKKIPVYQKHADFFCFSICSSHPEYRDARAFNQIASIFLFCSILFSLPVKESELN